MKKILLVLALSTSIFALSYNRLSGDWKVSSTKDRGSVSFGMKSSFNEPFNINFGYNNILQYGSYTHYYIFNDDELEISMYPLKNGKFRTKRSNDIYKLQKLPRSQTGGYLCYELKLIQKGMAGVHNKKYNSKICKDY